MTDEKKRSEKEELMNKVFGKDAPNRRLTEDDLKALNYDPFDSDNMSPEWKTLEENSKKLQAQTKALLDSYQAEYQNAAKEVTDADYEDLKKNLRQDFGDKLSPEAQQQLTIVHQQEALNVKYDAVEQQLNRQILCQKDYLHALVMAFRRPSVQGVQNSGLKGAVLIVGQKATGRHSSLQLAVQYLSQQGLLESPAPIAIDLSLYQGKESESTLIQDLYAAATGSEVILFDNLEQIAPSYLPYLEEMVTTGVLSLSKRYTLTNGQLTENSTALVRDTVKTLSFKNRYLFFITTKKPNKLLEIVGTRFLEAMSDVLTTRDIVKDDLDALYPQKAEAFFRRCRDNLNMDVSADETLKAYLKETFIDSQNVAFLNTFFDRAYDALAEVKLQNISDEAKNVAIHVSDGKVTFSWDQQTAAMEDYLPQVLSDAEAEVRKELDQLVGLTEIKKYVLSLKDFYAAQKLREQQGLKTSEVSKHMIFTGNPGTGKTTIARLIAKYLKAIGVLSNGQLVEVSRSDLVGKYMGHTAPQTQAVIRSALGGVLFIDEAYSLYRGTNDSFGLEAIDTLVKEMEDHRDDLIVILAGYTREMKEFLDANSGLASRFPNQIEFPDYTAEELYQIAVIQAKAKGYRLADDCQQPLTDYFAKAQAVNARRAGNGRLARNVIEDSIIHQSRRVVDQQETELDLIRAEDLQLKDSYFMTGG
jgi:AAA+ superfamily predicted ATPase